MSGGFYTSVFFGAWFRGFFLKAEKVEGIGQWNVYIIKDSFVKVIKSAPTIIICQIFKVVGKIPPQKIPGHIVAMAQVV